MSARYSIIPSRAIDDANLTHLDLRVLGCIGYHLSRDGNEAYPKQATIAARLGVTREAVNRSVARLRENGYVRVTSTKRSDGGNGVAVYHVILDPSEGEVIARSQGQSDPRDHNAGDRTGSPPEELPIGTPISEAKASGVPAELFPRNDPPPKPKPEPAAPADPDPFNAMIWTAGLKLLTDAKMREGPARAFLGRLIKLARGNTAIVANAVTACQMARAGDPGAWLQAAVRKRLPGTVEHRAASADEKAAELELRFRHFASGKAWKIHWGPAPDDPDADYPDALYAKTGVKRWEAVDV